MWVRASEWRVRERDRLEELRRVRENLATLRTAVVELRAERAVELAAVDDDGDEVLVAGPPKFSLRREPGGAGNLQRIVAEREGPWGPAGTLGGLVCGETNLSHEGTCWIDEQSEVHSWYTLVFGDARVSRSRLLHDCLVGGQAVLEGSTIRAGTFEGNARVVDSTISGGRMWCAGIVLRSTISGPLSLSGDLKVQNCHISVADEYLKILGDLQGAQVRRPSDIVQIGTTFGTLSCYRVGPGSMRILVGCKDLDSFDQLRSLAQTHVAPGEGAAYQLDMLEKFIEMVEPLVADW